MSRRRPLLSVAMIFGAVVGSLMIRGSAMSQSGEDAFYKGRTVRFIVGFGPGGGYDIYARMIAPYIGRALGANVVVENQPGAGGITALDNIAAAPPDGSQFMLIDGMGAALDQLVGLPGVRYDLGKLGHLGTASTSNWIWLVAPNSPIETLADALKFDKQMSWSASGQIDGGAAGAQFTCEVLSFKCRVVVGYPGSNEAALAVARGEIDSIYISDSSAKNYQKSWHARAIASMGHKRSRYFPSIPTLLEASKADSDKRWLLDYYATVADLGRIIVAPPNLPANRLAVLQDAVKKALTDPALIAEGERTERYVEFLDAEATRQAAAEVVETITTAQREQVRAILSRLN